jgi:hypothetical protein
MLSESIKEETAGINSSALKRRTMLFFSFDGKAMFLSDEALCKMIDDAIIKNV